ncbi:MAG: VanZ family protein [Endomicrobiia bacterium]
MFLDKLKKYLSLWVPVIFWCSVIFFFSSIPNLKIEALGFWDIIFRKIAHILEFGILTVLFVRAFSQTLKNNINFWSGFSSFVYATTDEFHQLFVPGRGPSPVDVFIDTIGIFLALLILKYVRKKKN